MSMNKNLLEKISGGLIQPVEIVCMHTVYQKEVLERKMAQGQYVEVG